MSRAVAIYSVPCAQGGAGIVFGMPNTSSRRHVYGCSSSLERCASREADMAGGVGYRSSASQRATAPARVAADAPVVFGARRGRPSSNHSLAVSGNGATSSPIDRRQCSACRTLESRGSDGSEVFGMPNTRCSHNHRRTHTAVRGARSRNRLLRHVGLFGMPNTSWLTAWSGRV